MIFLREVPFLLFFLFLVCDIVCRIDGYLTTQKRTSYAATDNQRKAFRNLSNAFRKELKKSIDIAEDQIEKLATFERNIHTFAEWSRIDKKSPFYAQMMDFLASSEEAINNTKSAFVVIKASQYLSSKFCNFHPNKQECIDELSRVKLEGTQLGSVCQQAYTVDCDPKFNYRTADGSCNNLQNPTWGKSNTPYRREFKTFYDDGIYSVRRLSADGRELPSARLISSTVSDVERQTNSIRTQALAIWGLFISYDLAYTPASNMVNMKTPITCCTNDGRPLSPRYHHVSCAPISIPRTDHFYQKYFQTCMNYVRSLPALRTDCTLGAAQQMNQASHFLDGSPIYGSTSKKQNSIREMRAGRLSMCLEQQEKHNEEFSSSATSHPSNLSSVVYSSSSSSSSSCPYASADARTASHPQLQLLHTLLLREHNRIADSLSRLNAHWNDERLYQEAKRILIAQIQHITYNEWLPIILGETYAANRNLMAFSHGFSHLYDEKLEPSLSNTFTTAALPFINSMIDGHIGFYSEERQLSQVKPLKDHFVGSTLLHDNTYFDEMVRGLATQTIQEIDSTFSNALTRYWYSAYAAEFGTDLFSLDIQKGRDHGLPNYIHLRKACNLSEVSTFADLRDGIIAQRIVEKLEKVYRKVADIDLIVGAVAEIPIKNASVGPTLRCIMGEQFFRIRTGDRFFYDNERETSSFTIEQLEQIRKSNLARVFCDNGNHIIRMQKDAFQKPTKWRNPLLLCKGSGIPFVDLTFWKEEEEEEEETAAL